MRLNRYKVACVGTLCFIPSFFRRNSCCFQFENTKFMSLAIFWRFFSLFCTVCVSRSRMPRSVFIERWIFFLQFRLLTLDNLNLKWFANSIKLIVNGIYAFRVATSVGRIDTEPKLWTVKSFIKRCLLRNSVAVAAILHWFWLNFNEIQQNYI